MSELSSLLNIGSVLEGKLNEVSINTAEELISLGSKETFARIKVKDPSACINMLMALEGAIQNIRWHNLSEETKRELKDFYNSL